MTPDKLTLKKGQRLKFLNALYEATDGDSNQLIDMWQLGSDLLIDPDDTQRVVEYLAGEDLLEFRALGGVIGITHAGVVQVEAALSKPDEPTRYFPPAVNFLSIENVINSQIQQGAQHSSIHASFEPQSVKEIAALVTDLRAGLQSLPISEAEKAEAEADAATLEAQANSPRPKPSVIRESLLSIRHVLEHAAGHALAVELLMRIGHLLGA